MSAENQGPYVTGGQANHPGVKGEPYNAGPIGGLTKVDTPGTGTFPSHMQGTTNKAQPSGLSSSNQYGYMSPGSQHGQVPLGDPAHFPIPEEKEGEGAGQMAIKQNQPFVPGVNCAHDAKFDNKGNLIASDNQKQATAHQVNSKEDNQKQNDQKDNQSVINQEVKENDLDERGDVSNG